MTPSSTNAQPATAPDKSRARSIAMLLMSGLALLIALLVAIFYFTGSDGTSTDGSDDEVASDDPATLEDTAETDEEAAAGDIGGADSGDVPADTEEPDGEPSADEAEANREQLRDLVERRDADDPAAVGPVDAPVVMVLYSDYMCPYCQQLATDTLPGVLDRVDDGDLRIEFRDVMFISEESGDLAAAAFAAGMQGDFMAYHEDLMADPPTSTGDFTADALQQRADDLGLDAEQFAQDMDSDARDAVATNTQEAQSIGVTGTPTMTINGRGLSGAQGLDVINQLIDIALEEDV